MKHMTHWLIVMGIVGGATAGIAHGEPYWVAWEGNDFPENEGWQRIVNGPQPAERTLADGIMTMDSLATDHSQDFYNMYGASDPGDEDEFIVQWRLRVNQVNWDNPNFPYDPGWSVNSADGWRAVFAIGVHEFHNLLEQIDVQFEPGVFHVWEFRSPDMRTFTISLDGAPISSGAFMPGLPDAHVAWGDFGGGPTSNVDWDYFRFGVVPEPTASLSALTLALTYNSRRRP
jgi:hypothetical protein